MNPEPDSSQGYSAIVPATLLFAALASLYTITYSGTYRVDDEHVLMARTQSLALWGELSNPQVFGNDRIRELEGLASPFAAQATSIEPAQAFVAAGLYRLGLWLGGGGAQTAFTLNIYATALTGVIVLLTVRSLDFGQRTAVWCGLLFGIATMAWPYAKTFYRDSLAMLAMSAVFLSWVLIGRSVGPWRWGALALAALAAAVAVLAKNTSSAVLPGMAVGGLILWWQQYRRGDRPSWLVLTSLIGPLLVLVGVAFAIPEGGGLARYTDSYYGVLARHFLANIKPGTLLHSIGPLVSPAKSIFIYSPILLALPFAIHQGWPRIRWLGVPALLGLASLSLAQALFYGVAWAGSFGWGLRFMLPMLPPLVVLGAPIVASLQGSREPIKIAAGWGLVIISIAVQVAGAVVRWYAPYQRWIREGLDPYTEAAAWLPRFLAIPNQMLSLPYAESWDLAWVRTVGVDRAAILIPLVAGAVLIATLALLSPLVRSAARPQVGIISVIALVGAMSVLMPVASTSVLLHRDPAVAGDQPELREAIRWLEARARFEDQILVSDYGSPIWHAMMNHWTTLVPWHSLPHEAPSMATEPSAYICDSVGGQYRPSTPQRQLEGRVWLVNAINGQVDLYLCGADGIVVGKASVVSTQVEGSGSGVVTIDLDGW